MTGTDMTIDDVAIARWRLRAQHLVAPFAGSAHDVIRLILSRAFLLTGAGAACGIAAALALTRVLRAQLFGVAPSDPLTFVVASLILIAVALAAGCIPALRASNVDPVVALRRL